MPWEPVRGRYLARRFSTEDAYEILRLAAVGILAWSLPEETWRPLSRVFGRVSAALHPERTRRNTRRIAATLADTAAANAAPRIAVEMECNRFEQRFQYMRSWRPGGWEPKINILGAEHLTTARYEGCGIIIWASNFSFNDLVTKMALHRLGLAVDHFSRPIHGFSETRFGMSYLNVVKRRIEDRYLGKRVMASRRGTRRAIKRLCGRLRENGVVSFTVGHDGRRRARARLISTRITLATGPLFIARTMGATLLPVFTLRTAPGQFEVTIGAPIELPDNESGEPDYAAAIQAYADSLTPFLLRDPGQWQGWVATVVGMLPKSTPHPETRGMPASHSANAVHAR